jgi:hypothetical protein
MSNGLVKRSKSGKRPKYGTIPLNLTNYQLDQISALTGAKIDSLRAWTEAREREIREAAIEEYTEKLHRSEDHASFVNLLISMYAIKMTWGFTKSQARFVENLNRAQEYVESVGIREAFDQIMRECGTLLEFDDFGIEDEIKELEGMRR